MDNQNEKDHTEAKRTVEARAKALATVEVPLSHYANHHRFLELYMDSAVSAERPIDD